MGLGEVNSRLYYEDFLRVFDEGHRINYSNKPEDVGYPQTQEIFLQLTPSEAEVSLRKLIAQQPDVIRSVSA